MSEQKNLEADSGEATVPRNSLTTNMGALLAAAGVAPVDVDHDSFSDALTNIEAAASEIAESSSRDGDSRQKTNQQHISSQQTSQQNMRLKTVPSLGTSPTALQDLFLNSLRRESIDCVFHLNDGSEEQGIIRAYDTFTVLLEHRRTRQVQLLYKHAIARISPARVPAALFDNNLNRNDKAKSRTQP